MTVFEYALADIEASTARACIVDPELETLPLPENSISHFLAASSTHFIVPATPAMLCVTPSYSPETDVVMHGPDWLTEGAVFRGLYVILPEPDCDPENPQAPMRASNGAYLVPFVP